MILRDVDLFDFFEFKLPALAGQIFTAARSLKMAVKCFHRNAGQRFLTGKSS